MLDVRRSLLAVALLMCALIAPLGIVRSPAKAGDSTKVYLPLVKVGDSNLYIPVMHGPIWNSPFATETPPRRMQEPIVTYRAKELGVGMVRLNPVSWAAAQRTQGAPYDWNALATFEADLLAAINAELQPVAVVHHYPSWAVVSDDIIGITSCAAIRADRFQDFASFMTALVERYSKPPYNVRYWELGNEPDVDPMFVSLNSAFGCWGDVNDPYYGGEHYGEMLKVVTPAIRAASPEAKVLIGGLLLATPETTTLGLGTPERFFEGILRAGAAPFFDIVPYHSYPSYSGVRIDEDLSQAQWISRGGQSLGKAQFLRETMARYGVSKPLHLNETGLLCTAPYAQCEPPTPGFFQAQADYVSRVFPRVLSGRVESISWYTLSGPGWRSTGLLDAVGNPRPAYFAYQFLIDQVRGARLPSIPLSYASGVEGYRFTKVNNRVVDVVWTVQDASATVSVPRSLLLAAYGQYGDPITPTIVGDNAVFTVGFSPIYIQRHP